MRTEQAYVLMAWDAEAIYIFKKVVVISKTIPVSSFIEHSTGRLAQAGVTAAVVGCAQQL